MHQIAIQTRVASKRVLADMVFSLIRFDLGQHDPHLLLEPVIAAVPDSVRFDSTFDFLASTHQAHNLPRAAYSASGSQGKSG